MGRPKQDSEFKQRIIATAESMGFTLECDMYEDKKLHNYPLQYLRFEPTVEWLRGREFVWVWFRRLSFKENLLRGQKMRQKMIKKLEYYQLLKNNST